MRPRVATCALVAAAIFSAPAAAGPLRTAVIDPTFSGSEAPLAFERVRQTGATVVRINLDWANVAPSHPSPGFRPADPADPEYSWESTDRQVQLAQKNRLDPLITVSGAPEWAQSSAPHPTTLGDFTTGPFRPDPVQLQAFAHAAASRYSGSFQGLPRVRYWEAWDEPNLIIYLTPQLEGKALVGADIYRSLVNAFATGIHSAQASDLVVAGALAPFNFLTVWGRLGVAPLDFMRRLLSKPIVFDVWSIHPYTSGGPTHHATEAGDVSLGDIPKMRRLLQSAIDEGRVVSPRKVQLWVTEFSWDTKPPDTNGFTTPLDLQARWTAEALYHMWKDGVSLATWFLLRDQPFPQAPFQSGLYFMSGTEMKYDRPKPTLTAFRFPFVAYSEQRGVYVWGRTPWGTPAQVVVERRTTRRWQRVGVVRTDGYGIFSKHLGVGPLAPDRRRKTLGSGSRYPAAVLADSPLDYWRFDTSLDGASPDERGSSPAMLQGGATVARTGGAIRSRGALLLDGKSGRALLGSEHSPATVELWVKTRVSSAETPIFSNRNALQQYVFLGTWGGLGDVFDDFHIFGTSTVNDGRWHQLVYTYEGIRGRIYVDGKLQGTAFWTRPEGDSPAYVGYDPPLKTYFKGSVDEVARYDYALSPARVAAHYVASGRELAPPFERGSYRARLLGTQTTSLPFSLHRPRDRYVLPFGGGGD